ncbi:hypothetical protein KC345_g8936, partial [Hortaea werneckii]
SKNGARCYLAGSIVSTPDNTTLTTTNTSIDLDVTSLTTTTIPPSGSTPGTEIVPTPPPGFFTTCVTTTGVTESVTQTGTPTAPGASTPVTIEFPIATNACAAPSCSASPGVNVAFYPAPGRSATDTYGDNPDYYMSLSPEHTGIADTLTLPNVAPPDDQGTSTSYYPGVTRDFARMTFDANNGTLVFQGYFQVDTTGDYEFCFYADNVDYFYLGSGAAFPCSYPEDTPSGATPFFSATYAPGRVCNTGFLYANVYYPVRSVYGYAGLPNQLDFTVNGSNDISSNLFRSSC